MGYDAIGMVVFGNGSDDEILAYLMKQLIQIQGMSKIADFGKIKSSPKFQNMLKDLSAL